MRAALALGVVVVTTACASRGLPPPPPVPRLDLLRYAFDGRTVTFTLADPRGITAVGLTATVDGAPFRLVPVGP